MLCISLFVPLEACETQAPTCECPTCEAADYSNVTLSQLSAQARERLRSEVMAEIHEEMKADWQLEWQREQHPASTAPLDDADMAAKSNEATDSPPEKPSEDAPRQPQKRYPSRPSIKLPPTQAIEKDERGLKVVRQAFSTAISRRLPVDERDTFMIEDASIFCFVEISSNDLERNITLRFMHSTGLTQSYELPVGQSPAWRTWSKLNLTSSMTGAWLCEVFNEDGVLLASKQFTVE